MQLDFEALNASAEISSDQLNSNIMALLSPKQSGKLLAMVRDLDAVQIADFLTTSDYQTQNKFLSITKKELDPEILTYLESDLIHNVVEILGIEAISELISKLEDSDDIIGILRDLPVELRSRIARLMPRNLRLLISEFLSYPEDSAGQLMSQVVAIPEDWTVSVAIEFLKHNEEVPDDLRQMFVMDGTANVVGSISLIKLLQAPGGLTVAEAMERDITTINATADQDEVLTMFRKMDLRDLAVTNDKGKILGVIRHEDVLDLMRFEIADDFMKFGGMMVSGNINARVAHRIVNRLPWLCANVFLSLIISYMVSLFSNTINHIVALAALLPIVTSIGGCSAAQTVSTTIRALACGEITRNNINRIAYTEVIVAIALGGLLAILSGAIVFIRYHDIGLSGVYTTSVVTTFFIASMMGLMIPMAVRKIRLDPAVVSPVIVSATADAFAYCFFLGIATLLLL